MSGGRKFGQRFRDELRGILDRNQGAYERVPIPPLMPYWFRLDGRLVMRGTLQEVRAAVAEQATAWLAADPEHLAADVAGLRLAFEPGGAVEESLLVWGDWRTTVGEQTARPVRLQVTKEEG